MERQFLVAIPEHSAHTLFSKALVMFDDIQKF